MPYLVRSCCPNQYGLGLGEIEVYHGPLVHDHSHHQRGKGLGRFFARAVQYLSPFIKSGINALKDQGIKSAGSIINQLGEEQDLKSILRKESQTALKNLKEKAINKINRSTGFQAGSGRNMPINLSSTQLLQKARFFPLNSLKKTIKVGQVTKKNHKPTGSRGGSAKKQVGGKRKTSKCKKKKCKQTGGSKKKSKKQTGGKRKTTKKGKKKSTKKSSLLGKQFDIFD